MRMGVCLFFIFGICWISPAYSQRCANNTTTTFQWPLENWRTNCNGYWSICNNTDQDIQNKTVRYHLGSDSRPAEATVGTPVHAACAGVVKDSGAHEGYGGTVIIECWTGEECVSVLHGHMFAQNTVYNNRQYQGLQVRVNDSVQLGQVIGYIADDEHNGQGVPHTHIGIHKGAYVANRLACNGKWTYAGYTRNLCVREDWYDPDVFIPAHSTPSPPPQPQPQPQQPYRISSELGPNPQTCSNAPSGGANTNWVYTCNAQQNFRAGDPIWAKFYIQQVRGNHTFVVKEFRGNMQVDAQTYTNSNVGNNVWGSAFFMPQLSNVDVAGTYRLEFFVQMEGGAMPNQPVSTTQFTVTAVQNNPAPQPQPAPQPPQQQQPYVYVSANNNPYTCASQPSGGANTNWVYTCEPDTTFHVNDTVWGNFYISTVRVNHRFQTQVYRNNVPIRTLGPTNVNPVSGVWDRATYWPDYRPDQPGQYEFKFQVDTGSGFVDVPGAIARFSVDQIVSPPFVIEPRVPTTCRGPINGGAATDWVFTCSNPTNQFRVGETAYALLRIQNVYDSHEFRAQFYRNGVRVGEPQRYTNNVDPAHPWNTAFFWPSYPNVEAGDWAVLITVTPLGGGDPATARASFTVR